MYFNVITFKNNKTLAFNSDLPFSADKVNDGWNVVVIGGTNQTASFRGSEVVSIVNQKNEPKPIKANKEIKLGKKTKK